MGPSAALGGLESNSWYGSGASRGKRLVAPAFAIGVGLRTGALTAGPQASLSLKWVGILTDGNYTNVIPLTIGIAF